MNIYRLHRYPSKLDHYKDRMQVPEIAWKASSAPGPNGKMKREALKMSFVKSPKYATMYAMRHGRFKEAEPVIMKDPYYATLYVEFILKQRWPEAEKYIMKNPQQAFDYARKIIKGRWPEAEQYIMKDSTWASSYAYSVMKSRWPEAEQYIKQDKNDWDSYAFDWNIK